MAAIQCPACGATLKSKVEIPPGKRVKCLKCAKTFVVPAAKESQPAPPNDLALGGPNEPIVRLEQRKRGSGRLLVIIGGLLMLCCCCTALPGAGWFFRDKLTSLTSDLIATDGKKDAKKDGKELKKDKTDDAPAKPPDGKPEPLNLVDFAKEWNADRQKANAAYKGRTVEVTGAVRGYSIDLERKPLVLIETDAAPNALIIHAATKLKEPWALADVRQTVSVRGKFKDSDLAPTLQETEYITTPQNKTPVYKAAELAAEAAKNQKAFKDKYQDKTMIVVGETLKLDNDEQILLKGFDDRPVQFYCFAIPKPGLGTLVKAGQEAKLYCVFKGEFPDPAFNPHKAVVAFADALPITGAK